MTSATAEQMVRPRERARGGGPVPPRGKPRKFLLEVQGLRALAVLMVVTYHVWLGRVSGGVDIFLLISSFLLTGQFTRKLETRRPLELLKYWVRLFKRLLPMIVVTLLGVLTATWLVVPKTRWTDILDQAWACVLYFQNWLLAANAVDYYAADHSQASPLEHFWSLSIQGQIFILWPLIFAGSAYAARRWRLKIRALLIYVFGAVFVSSLIFSIVTTYSNQTFAYFDTRARLWEFALGSLLALVLPYIKAGRRLRVFLGWAGVIAMLSCGIILQVDQAFPGFMALWPTLAAAAVIIAGKTDSPFGADRFLSWRPLVALGDSSYALYLIHWPILVIFLMVTHREKAGPFTGSALILLSLVLASLATHYIDAPLRKSAWLEQRRRRAVGVIAVCVLMVTVPLCSWQLDLQRDAAQSLAASAKDHPGAAVLRPGYVDKSSKTAEIVPAMTALNGQWVGLPGRCQGKFEPDDSLVKSVCGQTTVTGTPKKTLFVVGDSHAEQWMAALFPIAEKYNWQVVSLLKGGCDFGAAAPGRIQSCLDFNDAVTDYILDRKPDAVVSVSTAATPDSAGEQLVPGYEQAVKMLTGKGIQVVGLRDNPRFHSNKATCVAEKGPEGCGVLRKDALAAADPAKALNDVPGAFMIDLTDKLCPDQTCPAVIGNVLVYMDNNHLSKTYAASMAPDLESRLLAATGWGQS